MGYWAQIVHTRHERISDFILNLLAGMATFALYDTKPSINMKFEMEGEAEVKQLTLFLKILAGNNESSICNKVDSVAVDNNLNKKKVTKSKLGLI